MKELFRIETEKVHLSWSCPDSNVALKQQTTNIPGRLQINKRRFGANFQPRTWRAEVPEILANSIEETTGPKLFEETNYTIFVESQTSEPIRIKNRDPIIEKRLKSQKKNSLLHGTINFRSQVGMADFSVLVNGVPEFDFTVEVFPSKIDYQTDYKNMLAEIQEVLTGLALEYLRATYQPGKRTKAPEPTHLEWIVLLRYVVDDLQKALEYVALHPIRELERSSQLVRLEKIKRMDSTIRSKIIRGLGSGPISHNIKGVAVRKKLIEHKTRVTLNTPEHRWLSFQLNNIIRRLEILKRQQVKKQESYRHKKVIEELTEFENRILRLCRIEPLLAAERFLPPPGFASLKLLATPGYREAYLNILILSLGLRIEGGPINLSAKDIHLLYEYWCYIALLRLISKITDQPVPVHDILRIEQKGIQVLLKKGRITEISFNMPTNRKFTLTYSPSFSNDPMLIAQKPDMLLTFEDPNWPKMHFLLDAKYRIDGSNQYIQKYGSPGPPEDAINVLHRYRDSIIEKEPNSLSNEIPKHTVVQGAALFPYQEQSSNSFNQSKLWESISRIGIGAVPFLPGQSKHMLNWLTYTIGRGGLSISEDIIGHNSTDRVQNFYKAASETVLVGTLAGGYAKEHLNWIKQNNMYYVPYYPTQRRQFLTKWIALYSPVSVLGHGAVTHKGKVDDIKVVNFEERLKLETPWPSHSKSDKYVLYEIRDFSELTARVECKIGDERAFVVRGHIWTSKLAMERAASIKELFLGSAGEWQLYEDLSASEIRFNIEAGKISSANNADEVRHATFILEDGSIIQYAGTSGFCIRLSNGNDKYFAQSTDVIKFIAK